MDSNDIVKYNPESLKCLNNLLEKRVISIDFYTEIIKNILIDNYTRENKTETDSETESDEDLESKRIVKIHAVGIFLNKKVLILNEGNRYYLRLCDLSKIFNFKKSASFNRNIKNANEDCFEILHYEGHGCTGAGVLCGELEMCLIALLKYLKKRFKRSKKKKEENINVINLMNVYEDLMVKDVKTKSIIIKYKQIFEKL